MGEINYKQKYLELKQKYMNSVDTAFRLGYEQGQADSQVQQMQQQQADQQAIQQAAAGGQPGQPGEEQSFGQAGQQPGSEGQPGQPADSAHPEGSELDQHIAQLEGMLGKAELSAEDIASLKKSADSLKQQIELKKSQAAIKGIVKALNKSGKVPALNLGGSSNMTAVAKNALSAQEKIVQDLFKTWDQQEQNAGKEIKSILAAEGVTKKA